jgi:uncharacterized membrane protein YphA (DoxX/SURF4 family)
MNAWSERVRASLRAFARSWNDTWFTPAPLYDLAMCRIVMLSVRMFFWYPYALYMIPRHESSAPGILYDPPIVLRLFTLPLGYESVATRGLEALLHGPWAYRPSDALYQGVLVLGSITGTTALVGFWTRTSLGIFAVCNIFSTAYRYSFHAYNHVDNLISIAFVLLALAPCGAVLSLDSRRRPRVLGTPRPDVLTLVDPFACWPLLLMRVTVCLAFVSAAWCKIRIGGLAWLDGYTLQSYFQHLKMPLGLRLAQDHSTVRVLAITAWLMEAAFLPALFLPRYARYLAIAATLFHVAAAFTMGMVFILQISAYSVFVPWAAWGVKRRSARQSRAAAAVIGDARRAST